MSLSSLEKELLTALLLHGDRIYGLELLSRINAARQAQGMGQVGVGSLYPALKRLEEAGLIEGEWGEQVTESDSSRRRYYRITGEGANTRGNPYI